MKLVICIPGSSLLIFSMVKVAQAYFKGDDFHAGWTLPEETWDLLPFNSCELVQHSMYEGYEAAGSYVRDEDGLGKEEQLEFSWAVLPETAEEVNHLVAHCYCTGFLEMECEPE